MDYSRKKPIIRGILIIVLLILYLETMIVLADNVTTQANVTSSYPIIDSMTVATVDLVPGTTTEVNCTVQAHDFNGYLDIFQVNATLWDNSTVGMGVADDNETHYTIDTNCTFGVGADIQPPYNRTFSCSFDVWYYANAGSNWVCNATVMDNNSLTSYNYTTATINSLYALNVTPTIDFGQAAIGDTRYNRTANITNFGNEQINISVDAYGVTDSDGLAMDCAQSNIPLLTASSPNLRYTINSSEATTWGSLIGVNDTAYNVTGLTLSKVSDATRGLPSTWYNTYWSLYIPAPTNPFGICTGTVVFTAWSGA